MEGLCFERKRNNLFLFHVSTLTYCEQNFHYSNSLRGTQVSLKNDFATCRRDTNGTKVTSLQMFLLYELR
jgi:hypothetical protein